jgi:hypothetical protein
LSPSEAAQLALTIHAAILPAAALATRNYGDRSEWLQKSLTGLDALLVRLRQNLVLALVLKLNALPDPVMPPARLVVPATGIEPVLPRGGEEYVNSMQDFVRENAETLLSYAAVLRAKSCWAWWAQIVSWCTLLLLGYELIALATWGLVTQLLEMEIPLKVSFATLVPSFLLIGAFTLSLMGCAKHHDTIMRQREKHDPL